MITALAPGKLALFTLQCVFICAISSLPNKNH